MDMSSVQFGSGDLRIDFGLLSPFKTTVQDYCIKMNITYTILIKHISARKRSISLSVLVRGVSEDFPAQVHQK